MSPLEDHRILPALLLLLTTSPFTSRGPRALAQPRAEPPQEVQEEPATEDPALAGHRRMLERLAEIAARTPEQDSYLGEGDLPRLRAELTSEPPLPPRKRFKALRDVGFHELRLGRFEASIETYREALAMADEKQGNLKRRDGGQVAFELGLAYLRWGETRNCVALHTSDSCLLPIRAAGVHTDPEGSRRAIEMFERALALADEDAVKWLLNIAYMTVGEYPDGVPEAWRLAPEVFDSGVSFPRFRDIAPDLGLNSYTLSGGMVVDDFDGDGVLDVAASSWDPAGQLQLWRGQGDGTFRERTEEAGLTGILGGLNLVHGDYDGDGDLDLLVLRGAWLREAGRVPNSLLQNQGDGSFLDVTYAAGLGEVEAPTQTAAFADYDNDGDLDLYVGNETDEITKAPCQLFRNRGDGTFEDVARAAGVTNDFYAKGVVWGDYDGDRWPDLYVSNSSAPNRLYRNLGDGTFEDVAPKLGVNIPINSFPTWFWDYDDDGALDLYVAAYYPALPPVVEGYLGKSGGSSSGQLFRGDGAGGFTNVTEAAGLDRVTVTMGSNFGDLDGDGRLDMYLGTGYPGFEGLIPNVMYLNRGGEDFVDVSAAGGFAHLQKGHGVSFADFDGDGDLDVFEEMGGAFRGDAFGNALFENPGFGHRWLTVRLVGVESNRFGIGARLRLDLELEDGETRSLFRWLDGSGSFGRNPLTPTIGLGPAKRIARLEVYWPTSDTTQVFEDLPLDARVVVTEGEDELGR